MSHFELVDGNFGMATDPTYNSKAKLGMRAENQLSHSGSEGEENNPGFVLSSGSTPKVNGVSSGQGTTLNPSLVEIRSVILILILLRIQRTEQQMNTGGYVTSLEEVIHLDEVEMMNTLIYH